ncbi:Protein lifeguard 1 [Halotydeus destructor]|nr:Protein lifeguard 1 [Halotydeus destructor]
MADLEADFATDEGPFAGKQVRLAFIRKVYGIISAQLAVTFVPVILLTIYKVNNPKRVEQFLADNALLTIGVLLGMAIVMVGLSCAMSCCQSVRRTYPWNFIVLSVYTMATTVLVTFCTISYDAKSVALAVGLTMAITLGLTIFAFQTKIDFTVYMQLVFVVGLAFFLFSITTIFMRTALLNRIIAAFGAILFSFYIVIDTQLIVGGGRHEISPEEYIMAALMIYSDIINLFLYLLRLFGDSSD